MPRFDRARGRGSAGTWELRTRGLTWDLLGPQRKYILYGPEKSHPDTPGWLPGGQCRHIWHMECMGQITASTQSVAIHMVLIVQPAQTGRTSCDVGHIPNQSTTSTCVLSGFVPRLLSSSDIVSPPSRRIRDAPTATGAPPQERRRSGPFRSSAARNERTGRPKDPQAPPR